MSKLESEVQRHQVNLDKVRTFYAFRGELKYYVVYNLSHAKFYYSFHPFIISEFNMSEHQPCLRYQK